MVNSMLSLKLSVVKITIIWAKVYLILWIVLSEQVEDM